MKLISDDDAKSIVVSSSKGGTIFFPSNNYAQTRFKDVEDPFRELNKFIASRKETERDKLFELYKDSFEVLETVNNPKTLEQRLLGIMSEIYDIVSYRDMSLWAASNLVYDRPEGLSDHHENPDYPREGTYLTQDYHELIILSVCFTAALPIWSEYLSKVTLTVGNVNKELGCFQLLRDTKDILSSPPMIKLSNYVEHFCSDQTRVNAATLEGLTLDQIPDWLLSTIIVRRLAIGEIDANRGNLVAIVHMTMRTLMEDLNRRFKSFSGRVNDRKAPDQSDQESSNSKADAIKVQQDITVGQLTRYELAIEDSFTLAEALEPGIDPRLVQDCIEHSLNRNHVYQVPFHFGIMALVVNDAINGNILYRLENEHFMILQGIVQAILWRRGHTDLAIQLTATPMESKDNVAMLSDGKTRMSSTTTTRLVELYPYAFPDPGDNEARARRDNIGAATARLLTNSLETTVYKVECPEALWTQYSDYNPHRTSSLGGELLERVAALLIDTAERRLGVNNEPTTSTPTDN